MPVSGGAVTRKKQDTGKKSFLTLHTGSRGEPVGVTGGARNGEKTGERPEHKNGNPSVQKKEGKDMWERGEQQSPLGVGGGFRRRAQTKGGWGEERNKTKEGGRVTKGRTHTEKKSSHEGEKGERKVKRGERRGGDAHLGVPLRAYLTNREVQLVLRCPVYQRLHRWR